jgi:outer membrane protein OmpA-like peptidoglycan-associated protein
MTRPLGTLALALALFTSPARAQFGGLVDSIKDRAKRGAQDELGRQAEEAARGAVRVDKKGSPQPQNPAAPGAAADAKAQAAGANEGQGVGAGAPAAGEVYGNRYDFVPGDKVLAYDDFSDTDVGEYPAKWTIKGGGGNAVEVVEVGGRRFMKARYQKDGQEASTQWLRYAVKGDLPKKFTVEFDADVEGPFEVVFSKRRNEGGQAVAFHEVGRDVMSTNARGKDPFPKGLHHVAVAVSGMQVKAYIDGERVLTDPDAVERPITRLGIGFGPIYGGGPVGDHQRITNLRLAEGGGKDPKAMLAGEGRIVTHGILFDTGSDLIKPESGPTLRVVQALLAEDGALRFRIEGHTDDQGGPKVNGPLSERRAHAVRAWLVKEGISEKRLEAKGFGQTKPIDSNETAEGRANNRRVEFVKLSVSGS